MCKLRELPDVKRVNKVVVVTDSRDPLAPGESSSQRSRFGNASHTSPVRWMASHAAARADDGSPLVHGGTPAPAPCRLY